MSKYTNVLFCVVATLITGCAGKTKPKPPEPLLSQDGRCSRVQDRCLLGMPSGTGDTSSPYGWICLGENGGADTPCSVPTAPIVGDEFFSGQGDLVTRVNTAGPLRGKLVVFDHTHDDEGLTHASGMRKIILDIGVPEENLIFTSAALGYFLEQDEWREVREETRVTGHPTAIAATLHDVMPAFIARRDILHVAAAGNADQPLGGIHTGRDFWYPDHPWWKEAPGRYENAFNAFATGKLIIATFAEVKWGTVVPHSDSVRCGMAKEYCYSVPKHKGWAGTSSAASALSALTFYLFQLWDTPRKVVNVLNVCAEDVGEPGVDEEYGRGIVSVVCDTVQNREISVVAHSMQVSSAVSPVLSQMTGTHTGTRHVPQKFSGFKPFYAFRGYNPETMTGHLGGQFSLMGTDMFFSGGADYLPLGIRSSLLRDARTPFMELGAKQTLFKGNRYHLALLGTYGYSEKDNLSARVGHLGARYEQQFVSGTLSLHAGYRLVQATVGIPGYHEAGATPVLFTDGNPEVRFSFTLKRASR